MKSIIAAAAAVGLLVVAAPAGAQESVPAGVREHDGFFLQLQYLVGYQDLAYQDEFSISGAGSGFRIAIGGTPVRNFVIFGEMYGQVALNPEVEIFGVSQTANDASLTLVGFGPGLGYYFGDSGFFLNGALSLASAQLEGPGGTAEAAGGGARIGLGKEWWVSDQWGLGIASNLAFTSVTDADEIDYSSLAFSLAFSATYH